jgi:3',5'-cyclic AMP phosphodiesterase CpdA
MSIRRRDFLRLAVSASAAATVGACAEEEDAEPQSTTTDPDSASADTAGPDAGVTEDLGIGAQDVQGAEPSEVYGPSWMHLVGTTAVVRLQTLGSRPGRIFYTTADGEVEAEVEIDTRDLTYAWPPQGFDLIVDYPDLPGTYTVHTARLPVSATSETRWRFVEEGRAETTGVCPAVPAAGSAFRVGWISDTMQPASTDVGTMLGETAPVLWLHGGDIQYQSNPLDTWRGFFEAFQTSFRTSYVALAAGNHDYEQQDEFGAQYSRLFRGQFPDSQNDTYGSIRIGSALFVMLNSEDDFREGDGDGSQFTWASQLLQEAAANPDIRQIIVGFHRPFYTFSNSQANLNTRAQWHPLFKQSGVSLILTGHNHCYERFDVEGMHYIVDGGGGALTYDVDDTRSFIVQNAPEDLPLRKVAERTHGVTTLDFAADGAVTVTRVNINGATTDSFTIPPRPS